MDSETSHTPDVESTDDRHTLYVARQTDRLPSELVAEALAEVDGCRPEEMVPLHDSIDADALDELFAPTFDGHPRYGSVTFVHDGFEVAIHTDGDVEVRRVVALDERGASAATKEADN